MEVRPSGTEPDRQHPLPDSLNLSKESIKRMLKFAMHTEEDKPYWIENLQTAPGSRHVRQA